MSGDGGGQIWPRRGCRGWEQFTWVVVGPWSYKRSTRLVCFVKSSIINVHWYIIPSHHISWASHHTLCVRHVAVKHWRWSAPLMRSSIRHALESSVISLMHNICILMWSNAYSNASLIADLIISALPDNCYLKHALTCYLRYQGTWWVGKKPEQQLS